MWSEPVPGRAPPRWDLTISTGCARVQEAQFSPGDARLGGTLVDVTGTWLWWHDLFEIIGGVAAAIAVGFSVWVAFRERADRIAAEADRDDARRAEVAAIERERQRELEAQARRVVVWATRHLVRTSGGDEGEPEWRVAVIVNVGNFSDMPVTGVAVSIEDRLVVMQGVPLERAVNSTLLPHETVGGYAQELGENDAVLYPRSRAKRGSIELRFTDAAGVEWTRTDLGELTRRLPSGHVQEPSESAAEGTL